MRRFTTGELAKRAGVNRETVRYYERRRLLLRPPRTVSGFRIYSDDAVQRLRFIRHAKALGFSLSEIRELLELRIDSPGVCASVRERAKAKISEVDRKVAKLAQIRQVLTRLVATCVRRGTTSECPILDSLEAEDSALD